MEQLIKSLSSNHYQELTTKIKNARCEALDVFFDFKVSVIEGGKSC